VSIRHFGRLKKCVKAGEKAAFEKSPTFEVPNAEGKPREKP